MRSTLGTMKMLAVFLILCYWIHTGIAACSDILCSSCSNKQCNGDSCTCIMDGNGSGSEPCVIDDSCLLPGSRCCPSDLKFNNVTKCCNGLFSLYLIWLIL
ncbi:uncharacterized protein LOC143982387 isoform X2 [Lithobates pipiens]